MDSYISQSLSEDGLHCSLDIRVDTIIEILKIVTSCYGTACRLWNYTCNNCNRNGSVV